MRTGLYNRHGKLGAKIVDFSGWEMPLQYRGIVEEHLAVRERVGIFDVSHMGRILVTGPEAENLLDYLSTNAIKGKNDHSVTYTVWCLESGGTLDDLLVYKQSPTEYFVVVNAGNRQKDLNHLRKWGENFDVSIEDRFDDGILAIQGPHAPSLMGEIFAEAKELPSMHAIPVSYQGEEIILSRTGYTGEQGFEVYGNIDAIADLWDRILMTGQPFGIVPAGLGARDTLRLEMGFALYGHELTEEIAPIETVAAWTVKKNKGDFLGREALEHWTKARRQYGIMLQDRGIARQGYDLYQEEKWVGKVVSGTMSPSLRRPIAIILVEEKFREGDNIEVQIRHHRCRANIVKLPFYRRSS
ncbi:MAG: glycine cleavage system aminomethyltransferase GcvT [Waddliaceae bacterium]